jgi:alpha-N-arabinofuranosidase
MERKLITLLVILAACLRLSSQSPNALVTVYPDSILNDITDFPLGINVDYFMDDDNYLKPQTRTADALKFMGAKYLRYPGGNKSDCYLFSQSPYEKSDPRLARTGPRAVFGRNAALNESCTDFKNDVLDFDEFIAMCREVGAEPVICVAADEYCQSYPKGSTWSTRDELLENAVEWVRYSNIKKNYGVKYWMLANETWVTQSNPCVYANDVVTFSKAMKAVDPSIWIIPNGNMPEWWETVFNTAGGHFDAICNSNYPVNITDTIYTDDFNPTTVCIDAIKKYGHLTGIQDMKLIMAEYGPYNWGKGQEKSFVNNQFNNLINFEITGKQLEEPLIAFSCFWNTRWIDDSEGKENGYDALDKDGNLNANGQGLMIWGKYHGDKMVKTMLNNSSVGAFASMKSDEKRLFVYLYNKSDQESEIAVEVPGYVLKNGRQICELKGKNMDDQDPIFTTDIIKTPLKKQILPAATIRVLEYSFDTKN